MLASTRGTAEERLVCPNDPLEGVGEFLRGCSFRLVVACINSKSGMDEAPYLSAFPEKLGKF